MREDNYWDAFTSYQGVQQSLPGLPTTLLEWVTVTRPIIDGIPYTFYPYQYWIQIYREQAKRLMLLFARQLFKTTYLANRLGHIATAFRGKSAVYVAPDEDKLTTFDEKWREQTINQNAVLRSLCVGSPFGLPGHRSKIQWKTRSWTHNVTDEGGYKKVEGKSADLILLDEDQEHQLEFLGKLRESMSKKLGDLVLAGVGGEGGSELQREWDSTTQYQWEYDDNDDYHGYAGQSWRKDLQFDKHGLIYGPYMADVCKGKWIADKPENYIYPGYHLSQVMACHVPLTEADAIDLYKLPPEFSVEWKRKNYPKTLYISHVQADFYRAARRPLTREDVLALMEPYRYLNYFSPQDVTDLKQVFPERVQIYMGIDWGSGSSGNSQTIISILLKWRGMVDGRYSSDRDRYFLIYQEIIEPGESHTLHEAERALNLFRNYRCDFGCGDLGYGEIQVDFMINGGRSPGTGARVTGLSPERFIGTWTRNKVEAVKKDKPWKYDEEGSEEVSHILLDKTHTIQNFVDVVKWKVPHPKYPDDEMLKRKKIAIPFGDEWKVDYMIKDFTSITRKDIDEDLTAVVEDPRQKARKEFNHPPDSAVSIMQALTADQHHNQSGEFGGTWSNIRKGPSKPGPGRTDLGAFRGTRS